MASPGCGAGLVSPARSSQRIAWPVRNSLSNACFCRADDRPWPERQFHRQLCRKQLHGFVTCFLAFFEPGTRQLTYASAGHPRPLLKGLQDGAVSRLDAAAGRPLGIDPSFEFAEASLQLHRGDTLLLYTDGITDARNQADEWFDIARLELAFQRESSRPSEAIRNLSDVISRYQDRNSPVDDQTMVIARVT